MVLRPCNFLSDFFLAGDDLNALYWLAIAYLKHLPTALSFGRELASPTNNTIAKTNNIFLHKRDDSVTERVV